MEISTIKFGIQPKRVFQFYLLYWYHIGNAFKMEEIESIKIYVNLFVRNSVNVVIATSRIHNSQVIYIQIRFRFDFPLLFIFHYQTNLFL